MIPQNAITEWARAVPWPTQEQVEQDLLLSRLMIEIARDDYLGAELALRGGTTMHKLYLSPPRRYSEDLDYVRSTAGGIGQLTGAVTAIGVRLGMRVSTRLSVHPKIYLRAAFTASPRQTMRVKVEVNTHELSPTEKVISVPFRISSMWFSGGTNIRTFGIEELLASKIRALYQRSKGRDLFDLWLGLTQMSVRPMDIAQCFARYRPEGYTQPLAIQNLRRKVADPDFREDLRPLVSAWPQGYDVEHAAEHIALQLLALV